jgi:hypothetical protein
MQRTREAPCFPKKVFCRYRLKTRQHNRCAEAIIVFRIYDSGDLM